MPWMRRISPSLARSSEPPPLWSCACARVSMQSGARVNACCGVARPAELCDARRSFRHALRVIAAKRN
jgi:hypothetical protein